MTVGELIKKLEKFDPNEKVIIGDTNNLKEGDIRAYRIESKVTNNKGETEEIKGVWIRGN